MKIGGEAELQAEARIGHRPDVACTLAAPLDSPHDEGQA